VWQKSKNIRSLQTKFGLKILSIFMHKTLESQGHTGIFCTCMLFNLYLDESNKLCCQYTFFILVQLTIATLFQWTGSLSNTVALLGRKGLRFPRDSKPTTTTAALLWLHCAGLSTVSLICLSQVNIILILICHLSSKTR
jgi:hypothetical protein